MTERAGLMPDDVEWLEQQLRRIETKLDGLQCTAHAVKLAAYTQKVDDLISAQKLGMSKGAIALQAIIAIGVIGSLVIAVMALKS